MLTVLIKLNNKKFCRKIHLLQEFIKIQPNTADEKREEMEMKILFGYYEPAPYFNHVLMEL